MIFHVDWQYFCTGRKYNCLSEIETEYKNEYKEYPEAGLNDVPPFKFVISESLEQLLC